MVEFSETSLVVTAFSREFGKLRAIAKGARRPKGPFESALDLLALCRIVFLRKSSDALDLLTEAKLIWRFRPAGRDLGSLYAAYYVAELLTALTDEYDPHVELFDLAEAILRGLSRGEPPNREVIAFELGMLRELGMLPSLSACAACGQEIAGGGRVAFGQLDGGVLCGQCRAGKRHVALVTAGALKTMARLAEAPGEGTRRIEIDAKTRGEIRGLLNDYVAHLLGRRPQMHRYLTGTARP